MIYNNEIDDDDDKGEETTNCQGDDHELFGVED